MNLKLNLRHISLLWLQIDIANRNQKSKVKIMTSIELRKKFLDFFKKRGHKIVPSSSLIPEDKTVLLTSAGMQQFIPYLSGEKDVVGKFGTHHLASIQKCFRTPDIEEVGDENHHTFFEMMGNWSIGEDEEKEYFKKGAIKLALDFFVKELGLRKEKFWVTIFKGENNIPRDEEALKIWRENGIPKERIKEFGLEDNFWGPIGEKGPCGPCSEIHYDRGEDFGCGNENCGPNCKNCERFVELWNLVFMEYDKQKDGTFNKLPRRNVDTGIGFERLVALLQKKNSAYETALFLPIIKKIEQISGWKYEDKKRIFRIIADHIRGSVFLTADGVLPSNVEKGYVLRRLLRRAIRYGKILKMPEGFLIPLVQKAIEIYQEVYPKVKSKETDILTVIQKEEEKFEKTLEKGLKILNTEMRVRDYIPGKKIEDIPDVTPINGFSGFTPHQLTGKWLFNLYQTFGFPLELALEELITRGRHFPKRELEKIRKEFQEEIERHREISRAGAEKKFGGIGKEATLEATKLHTATHLLHQALREVLGSQVKQMGSDISSKRLRFDFSYSSKMTKEEINKVEEIVNQKIEEDLEIRKEEMPLEEALDSGALAFFKEKYPGKVTVFSIGDFSKEICAGPHIGRTLELGKFKITKEESSGAGVRRIRAILK